MSLRIRNLKAQLGEVLVLPLVSVVRLNHLHDVSVAIGNRTKFEVPQVDVERRVLHFCAVEERVRLVIDFARRPRTHVQFEVPTLVLLLTELSNLDLLLVRVVDLRKVVEAAQTQLAPLGRVRPAKRQRLDVIKRRARHIPASESDNPLVGVGDIVGLTRHISRRGTVVKRTAVRDRTLLPLLEEPQQTARKPTAHSRTSVFVNRSRGPPISEEEAPLNTGHMVDTVLLELVPVVASLVVLRRFLQGGAGHFERRLENLRIVSNFRREFVPARPRA